MSVPQGGGCFLTALRRVPTDTWRTLALPPHGVCPQNKVVRLCNRSSAVSSHQLSAEIPCRTEQDLQRHLFLSSRGWDGAGPSGSQG